ncbi:MAG: hypothetical protein IJR93_05145 [Treponema sp.]|nr:hypothetical protein [Treponema sp.]
MAEEKKAAAKTAKVENALMTWENEEFGSVRSMVIDDEPWFVAKDVATALGYKDINKATKTHVDEEDRWVGETPTHLKEKRPFVRDKLGRKQFPMFINESGLYALIFGSQLEGARKFKRWVTSEVLPAIRKSGNYTASPAVSVREVAVTLQKLTERVSALEQGAVREMAASAPSGDPAVPGQPDSRSKLVALVKRAAKSGDLTEREVWSDLYRGYSAKTGLNLSQCAKAMNMSVISFVDFIGRMDNLRMYAEQVLWFA